MMLAIFALQLAEGTSFRLSELSNNVASTCAQEAIYTELSSMGELIEDTLYTEYANINFTSNGAFLNLKSGSVPIEGLSFDGMLYSLKLAMTPGGYDYQPYYDNDWKCYNCKEWNPYYIDWQCANCGHGKTLNPKRWKDVKKKRY